MKRKTHIYSDTVIALSPDEKFTNEDAFKYKMLSHYIKNVEVFRHIVLNKTLCFSSLHKLKDKSEENAVSRRNAEMLFSFSFTHKEEYDPKMMDNFGDKGNGMRLKFFFKTTFSEELIEKNKPVLGYYDDKHIYNFPYFLNGCNILRDMLNSSDERCIKDIFVEFALTDIFYEGDKLKDVSVLNIENKKSAILNYVAKQVKERYSYQEETRLIAKLRSDKDREIDYINRLIVPIKFDIVEKLEITFGNNMSNNAKNEVKSICQSANIDNIISYKEAPMLY